MLAQPLARRSGLCLAIATLALLVPAGASHAAAETGTFAFQDTFTDAVDLSGTCVGGSATGTISGIESVSGHFTENGPPAFGFHAHGTSLSEYRVDFDDARYALGESVEHFDENASGSEQLGDRTTSRDQATLYSSDGQVLGSATIHATSHLVYRDANANRQPDPGEIRTQFDRLRLTCG